MDARTQGRFTTISLLFTVLLLTGCGGGSKMLKQPIEARVQQPIASASNAQWEATVDWVIVKDGPGTWAKNAWWDEYMLHIANRSDRPITLLDMQVSDSLETTVSAGQNRKQLVKGSKQAAKRYKKYDLEIKPGAGTGTLVAAGTGAFVVASAAAGASIAAGISNAFTLGTAGASAPSGLMLLGNVAVVAMPVLFVGGIVKGANNSKVNKEIIARRMELPAEIPAGEIVQTSAFFPVSPSPRSLRLVYVIDEVEHELVIDTSQVLDGLHLDDAARGDGGG